MAQLDRLLLQVRLAQRDRSLPLGRSHRSGLLFPIQSDLLDRLPLSLRYLSLLLDPQDPLRQLGQLLRFQLVRLVLSVRLVQSALSLPIQLHLSDLGDLVPLFDQTQPVPSAQLVRLDQ